MSSSGKHSIKELLGKTKSRRCADIEFSTGEVIQMYFMPLTLTEENKVREAVGTDTRADAYGIKVLIAKAEYEDGTKMFTVGDTGYLRNECAKKDVEEMMLALLTNGGSLAETDMKSAAAGAED
jgi:hypothetical protein